MADPPHSSWIDSCFGCLRSCFGLRKSAGTIEDDDERSKFDMSQKPLMYDSFLSSSTYDLEHSYFHHLNNTSLQSLEKSIACFNSQAAAEGGSTAAAVGESQGFRNQGLQHWNETRQQWLGRRRQRRKSQEANPRISWNATYENLLGTNRRFSQPIPLSEMVEFLVDVWEQEGLYENTTFGII